MLSISTYTGAVTQEVGSFNLMKAVELLSPEDKHGEKPISSRSDSYVCNTIGFLNNKTFNSIMELSANVEKFLVIKACTRTVSVRPNQGN